MSRSGKAFLELKSKKRRLAHSSQDFLCNCTLSIFLLCSQIVWDGRPGCSEKGSSTRGSVRVYCFSRARHKGPPCLRGSGDQSCCIAVTSRSSHCPGIPYSFFELLYLVCVVLFDETSDGNYVSLNLYLPTTICSICPVSAWETTLIPLVS